MEKSQNRVININKCVNRARRVIPVCTVVSTLKEHMYVDIPVWQYLPRIVTPGEIQEIAFARQLIERDKNSPACAVVDFFDFFVICPLLRRQLVQMYILAGGLYLVQVPSPREIERNNFN